MFRFSLKEIGSNQCWNFSTIGAAYNFLQQLPIEYNPDWALVDNTTGCIITTKNTPYED